MKITRSLLNKLTFRPFSAHDYMAFGGVSSPCPMIAEGKDADGNDFLVVLDGGYAELYTENTENGAATFCDDITELPPVDVERLQAEETVKQAAAAVLRATERLVAAEKALALL